MEYSGSTNRHKTAVPRPRRRQEIQQAASRLSGACCDMGQDCERQRHGREHGKRREEMDDFVCRTRHEVFLDDCLDAVSDGLAEAEQADFRERNADAVRAVAVLDAAETFAFEHRGDGKDRGENEDDHCDSEDDGNEWLTRWRKQRHRRCFVRKI